jgi:hypothetical protein
MAGYVTFWKTFGWLEDPLGVGSAKGLLFVVFTVASVAGVRGVRGYKGGGGTLRT